MAKALKKKAAKESKIATTTQIIKHIQQEITKVVPDYNKHVVLTITDANEIFYNINNSCPQEKYESIERIILVNVALFNLPVITEDVD